MDTSNENKKTSKEMIEDKKTRPYMIGSVLQENGKMKHYTLFEIGTEDEIREELFRLCAKQFARGLFIRNYRDKIKNFEDLIKIKIMINKKKFREFKYDNDNLF